MIRRRPTARVLLLDPEDRILLMQGRDLQDPDRPPYWFTIGGGIDRGETVLEAARREIVEETGFEPTQVGPVLWYTEAEIRYQGEPWLMQQHFVLARCEGGEPSRDGWTEVERAFATDLRWWTRDEIAASVETIFPRDIANRLDDVLADAGSVLSDAGEAP